MATEYTFVDDNASLEATVLVQENAAWEEENCDENQSHYSDAVDVTLSENNIHNYEATHDSDNDTHYYSILDDTNEINLNDLSQSTITHSNLEIDQNQNLQNDIVNESVTSTVGMAGQQVVLFKIDGSDELYGLQVAQNEDGNLQRFQFKVRQNEEGNFEAIPETIQLSPIDYDISQLIPQENYLQTNEELLEKENDSTDLLKSEYAATQENIVLPIKHEHQFLGVENDEEEYEYQDEIDIKPTILSTPFVNQLQAHIETEENMLENELEKKVIVENREDHFDEESNPACEETLLHIYEPSIENDESDVGKEVDSEDDIEQIFVKEGSMIEGNENEYKAFLTESDVSQNSQEYEEETEEESDSDNEEYQIVNGMHITADAENNLVEELSLQGKIALKANSPYQTRILKVQKQPENDSLQDLKIKSILNTSKNLHPRKLLVLKNVVEKENMSLNVKANPRSILKSTQALINNSNLDKATEEEKFEKRFAKSKEAIRAKLFQNFIAQTKIIHAPVRNERLPRKQKIQPVTRTDEEIIVQEVFVPSNGYSETKSKERATLKSTETIQLSDTDEDYDPRKPFKIKRKLKKRKSHVEIIITDSSESEQSIVDLSLSDSDIEHIIVEKKKRGRPPKSKNITEELDTGDAEVPVKRGRGRPTKSNKIAKDNVDEEKKGDVGTDNEFENQKYNTRKRSLSKNISEKDNILADHANNKCAKCSKIFPSVGSLKTHMHYHNFTESNRRELRNNQNSKYKCDECKEIFSSDVLLKSHMNVHKRKLICNVCKKKFSDNTQLLIHKKSHLKEQMFKSSVTINVTPRKIIHKSSEIKQFKCTYCERVLPSAILLSSHLKNHAFYRCTNCNASFVSKFTRDNHITKYCVKMKPSPQKKRISLSVTKKFVPKINEKSSLFKKSNILESKPVKKNMSTTSENSIKSLRTNASTSGVVKKRTFENSSEIFRKSMYNTRSIQSGLVASNKLRNATKSLIQLNK